MGDNDALQDKVLNLIKSNFLILALFLGGVAFLSIGLVQMLGEKTASVKFERAEEIAGAKVEASSVSSKIKVDVEGQVMKPGVYTLVAEARVQDALIAAGGLSDAADRNSLNLAQRISDGQKIYVPAVGETSSVVSANSTEGGMVSINSGTLSALESLPGIGPVSGQKIIDNRPYSTIDELLSKKAVGPATFEKIKGLISL